MCNALRSLLAVLFVGLIGATAGWSAEGEPAPIPVPEPATTPTPGGETPAATEPHVVTPTSGPGAPEAAADAAVLEAAGAKNAMRASELFGYSFRIRVGLSAWQGSQFQSEYKSSTADLRGQAAPDRIDWPKALNAELDSIALLPELELCFGVYQYIRLSWYRYNFKGTGNAPKIENYGDIFYPAGTPWKGKGFLEQFDILYEIAVVKNPPSTNTFLTFEWRLGFGAKVVNYEFIIQATGPGLLRYDAIGTTPQGSVNEKDAQTIPVPIASSYFEFSMGEPPSKFGLFLDTQWISTPQMAINGDKFAAQVTDVKSGIFYYPWTNLKIQVAYRYWRAKIGFEENGGQGREVDGFSNISGAYAGLVFQY